jgi:hypothetical protein
MEMPVIAAWDAVVRAWRVVVAWIALRRATRRVRARVGSMLHPVLRPADIAQLAAITDPKRFVRLAIALAPTDRQVALVLALAVLPGRRRAEAAITLLACKALRAFDRDPAVNGGPAAVRDDVAAAVTYLSGESHAPPHVVAVTYLGSESHASPHGVGPVVVPAVAPGADRLDAVLAARLPILRAAIETLPGDAGRRCRATIERIGGAMVRPQADRRGGAAHALGEAVVYAARLVAPSVRPPDTACRAAGCALQLADELRDAETSPRRSWLLSRTLPAASELARLARWLPVSVGAGARAAAALLIVTSCATLLREAGIAMPRRLQRPLRAALAAAKSRDGYLAAVTAIDGAIRDALTARPTLLEGTVAHLSRSPEQDLGNINKMMGTVAHLSRSPDAGDLREHTAQIPS